MSARDALRARVLQAIETRVAPEALFLDAYRYQQAASPLLARLWTAEARGIEDIPAVPVALFKDLDLGPVPPLPGDVLFRTSGTTGSARGVHRSRDTLLYDLGAVAHYREMVRAGPARVVSICPVDADSSLGHMVALFGPVEAYFDGAVSAGAWAALQAPCLLATTAFALDALFATEGAATLDARSVVMVTGGFKGRHARLDAPALYEAIPARLGSPRVVGEYGMTELSSQSWTAPVAAGELPGAFVAPPWMRVYAADPHTGRAVEGEGVLRFVDLCNLDSVLAIETQDLGRVERRDEGDRVTLLGRLEGAELRGCSLRAERLRVQA
ncbi:MAG: hypothetical protein FJ090_15275 [Deltaproteobacteria bacterium]|nr:hypothetical protein [Deltaproteobacteria bacterium]